MEITDLGASKFQIGVKFDKIIHWSKKVYMAKESAKSENKTHTPEFLILSERLKEAVKLKASGKYRDRNFDKLVDKLWANNAAVSSPKIRPFESWIQMFNFKWLIW